MSRFLALTGIALALRAEATDTLAVLAVADPPGPGAELAEPTQRLRDACRARVPGVLEIQELQSRLGGEASGATLDELQRAVEGAWAEYQNGRYEGAIRRLRTVVADLDRLPEGPAAHALWIRTLLLLAHAEATLGRHSQARAAMERVAAVEPQYRPDAEQFSPTYRRAFEAARARVAARPRRQLTVTSAGPPATVYVDGRASGSTPLTLALPAGRYRIGGAAQALRLPSDWIDLRAEDRSLVLDLPLAQALRLEAGPGLALAGAARAPGVARAGARLGVDQVLAVSLLAEPDARYLVGSLHDVHRGVLVREGRVRLGGGAAAPQQLEALAAFLLTGQPAEGVEPSLSPPEGEALAVAPEVSPATLVTPVTPVTEEEGPTEVAPGATPELPLRLGIRPQPWMRPTAHVVGAAALLLAGYATYQAISAHGEYQDARGMVRPDGTLAAGITQAQYAGRLQSGDSATQRAYLAAGGAVIMAALAGVLWYVTGEPQPAAPAIRF